MKKIVVVHAAEELKTGGMERNLANIAIGLDKDRYKVIVLGMYSGGPIADELISKGIDVRILGIRTYLNPVNIFKLCSFFRKENVDILHTHTYFSNTIGRISAVLAGIPVKIVHIQNVYNNYTPRNLWIEHMLSRITDRIICCSDAVREFAVRKERVSEDKLTVIFNSVDMDIFRKAGNVSALKESFGILPGERVITTVASLTAKKGHVYFLEALHGIVNSADVKVKYLVAGGGPLEEELRNIVKEKGLQQYVNFIGERKDVRDILGLTDIFVLPSLTEGLPLCVIEAMSSGVPVVATDVGGTSEIVEDGATGILVEAGDPEDLKTAVMELLSDKEKASKMGEAGKALNTEKFSAESMVTKIDDLYKDIIDEKTDKGTFCS